MNDRSPLAAALGGSGFGIVGVTLIALKLLGLIGWSWWLVSFPLWAPAVAVLVLFGGFSLFLAAWCRWQLVRAD